MQATFSYRSIECGFAHTSTDSSGKISVRASMPGAANAPCITVIDKKTTTPSRYYTSKICITAPIVSKGDGELTVFHTCSTNGANIIAAVSVFALRTNTQSKKVQHSIDKIISAAKTRIGLIDLNLADYANYNMHEPSVSNAVLIDGIDCMVWLHNREIIVDHDFATFGADASIIYASPPLFTLAYKEPIIEGADETLTCEYKSLNDGEDILTYALPISSKAVSLGQTNASADIISTITLITVLFVFTFMLAPVIYPFLRSTIYRNDISKDQVSLKALNDNIMHVFSRLLLPKIVDSDGMLLNITNLGSIITIGWVILSIILLIIGSSTNELSLILGGMYMFIIIGVAVISNTFFSVLHKNQSNPITS